METSVQKKNNYYVAFEQIVVILWLYIANT